MGFNSPFNSSGGSQILTDLEVDGTTVVVDETNDKVGIGLAAPKTKLTVEGTITLKEQADADADTAAYGQVWVNTATPNELYFTTDAGNDISITTGTTLNVTDLHTAGVDGSANQLLTDDGDGTVTSESKFTFDGKTCLVNTDTSGDLAENLVALHVDFDRTVASSGTAAHNDIGINLDVDSRSLGTSSATGMDVDVVGHTDGTHTAVGLNVSVSGADNNYGMLLLGTTADLILGAPGNTDNTVISSHGQQAGTTAGKNLIVKAGNSVYPGSEDINGGNLVLKGGDGDGTGTSKVLFYSKTTAADAATERMRIGANGNLVIGGTQAHAASLALDSAVAAVALKEMSDAPTDTAAFGQVWVKTATPNELYFTTDAGDDIQLTSGTAVAGGGGSAADDESLILHMQVFA